MGANTWHVEPHDAGKSSAAEDNRGPESTALVVPFETGGSTVRDHETEHGTQSKLICLTSGVVGEKVVILTLSAAWAEWRGGGRSGKSG